MEFEEWVDISGCSNYQVSREGHIRQRHKEKYIVPWLCNGYAKVTLTDDNKKTREQRVHRVVANHFLQNVPGKDQVNHKDGNQLNNHASNLEWVTGKENMKHFFEEVGGRPRRVKLYFTRGEESMTFDSIEACAKHFGKARATIWGYSLNGRAWGWNIRREEQK